jgi:hypothetical protein
MCGCSPASDLIFQVDLGMSHALPRGERLPRGEATVTAHIGIIRLRGTTSGSGHTRSLEPNAPRSDQISAHVRRECVA